MRKEAMEELAGQEPASAEGSVARLVRRTPPTIRLRDASPGVAFYRHAFRTDQGLVAILGGFASPGENEFSHFTSLSDDPSAAEETAEETTVQAVESGKGEPVASWSDEAEIVEQLAAELLASPPGGDPVEFDPPDLDISVQETLDRAIALLHEPEGPPPEDLVEADAAAEEKDAQALDDLDWLGDFDEEDSYVAPADHATPARSSDIFSESLPATRPRYAISDYLLEPGEFSTTPHDFIAPKA